MKLDPHYTNSRLAALYDFDSPWGEDTDFYIAIAGSEPLKVADVGCGTGTLACGLKAAGHEVVGIDPAESMLELAKTKALGEQITWLHNLAADFSLPEPCDLMTMTGHAFQVLLSDDDILSALVNFERNLKPGGRLVFESRNPDLAWDEIWGTEAVFDLGDERVKQLRSGYQRSGEYVEFTHTFEFNDFTLTSDSKLRFASRETITTLLGEAGFELLQLFGDWRGAEFSADSLEMIFVCQRHNR